MLAPPGGGSSISFGGDDSGAGAYARNRARQQSAGSGIFGDASPDDRPRSGKQQNPRAHASSNIFGAEPAQAPPPQRPAGNIIFGDEPAAPPQQEQPGNGIEIEIYMSKV